MIKICRSIRIAAAAAAAAATSLLSICPYLPMCMCAINSTKIVFMMCLLRCIYDVLPLYSTFSIRMCLSSSVHSTEKEILNRSVSSIEVYGV